MWTIAAYARAEKFLGAGGLHSGEDLRNPFPRLLTFLAALAGGCLFFASFGFWALPILGWGWFDCLVGFTAFQAGSHVLLDVPEYWHKATAFFGMTWILARDRSLQIFNPTT